MKQTKLLSLFCCIGIAVICSLWLTTDHNKDIIIAHVNGYPVSQQELLLTIQDKKALIASEYANANTDKTENPAQFWNTPIQGVTPADKLKKDALDEAIRIKLIQSIALKKGQVDEIDYPSMMQQMKKENERRAAAIAKHEVIYGPVSYNERTFFLYTFNNLEQKLIEELKKKEFALNENEIQDYYNANSANEFQSELSIQVSRIRMSFFDSEKGTIDQELKKQMLKNAQLLQAALQKGEDPKKLTLDMPEKYITMDELELNSERDAMDKSGIPNVIWAEVQKLGKGEVSPIMEDSGAFVIMKSLGSHSNRISTLDEVRNEVMVRVYQQKFESYIEEEVKQAAIQIDSDKLRKLKI